MHSKCTWMKYFNLYQVYLLLTKVLKLNFTLVLKMLFLLSNLQITISVLPVEMEATCQLTKKSARCHCTEGYYGNRCGLWHHLIVYTIPRPWIQFFEYFMISLDFNDCAWITDLNRDLKHSPVNTCMIYNVHSCQHHSRPILSFIGS